MKNIHTNTNPTLDQSSDFVTVAKTVATTIIRLPATVFTVIANWQNRMSQREHLGELDNRLLKDMGLTPSDVFREASKPFWVK